MSYSGGRMARFNKKQEEVVLGIADALYTYMLGIIENGGKVSAYIITKAIIKAWEDRKDKGGRDMSNISFHCYNVGHPGGIKMARERKFTKGDIVLYYEEIEEGKIIVQIGKILDYFYPRHYPWLLYVIVPAGKTEKENIILDYKQVLCKNNHKDRSEWLKKRGINTNKIMKEVMKNAVRSKL